MTTLSGQSTKHTGGGFVQAPFIFVYLDSLLFIGECVVCAGQIARNYGDLYNILASRINVQTLAVVKLILSACIDTTQIAVAVPFSIHSE